jgi:hypothetical protein
VKSVFGTWLVSGTGAQTILSRTISGGLEGLLLVARLPLLGSLSSGQLKRTACLHQQSFHLAAAGPAFGSRSEGVSSPQNRLFCRQPTSWDFVVLLRLHTLRLGLLSSRFLF